MCIRDSNDTVLSLTKDKKVGIGTINPTSLLTVGARPKTTAVAATVLISPASGNASIQLRGGSPTLEFDGTGGGNGQIFTDSADLTISNGTLDGAGTELVRITSTGQLQATGSADVRLTLGSSGTAGTNDSVHVRADSANLKFMAASGGNTIFETNGTETLRITSGANVAIGTDDTGLATYGDDLTIARTSHVGMTLRSGTGHKGSIYFSDGTSGLAEYKGSVQYDHADDSLRFAAGDGTVRLHITSDGSVGIGTNSPDTLLHIEGQSNDSFVASNVGTPYNFTIFGNEAFDSGKAGGGVVFGGYTNSTGGQAILGLIGAVKENNTVDDNAGALIFMPRTNGQGSGANEKMRLTSGGDLILGGHGSVIEPQGYTSHLEIHGTDYGAGISLIRYSDDYKGPQIVLGKSRNASVGLNSTVHHNDELGKIVFAGTDTGWEPGAAIIANADDEWYTDNGGGNDNTDSPGRLSFWTTPNGLEDLEERLRIDNQGNVGIGTQVATDPIGTQNVAKLAVAGIVTAFEYYGTCLLYTSPSPRDRTRSRMPSSA